MHINDSGKFIPFGYKLMLSYAVFILPLFIIFGYLANTIFVGSVREQTQTNINGTLQQMKDNIAFKMEDIERISDMLYYDASLSNRLRRSIAGWTSYETMTQYLLPRLHQMIESTNRKLWISVYLKNETLPEIYSLYGGDDPLELRGQSFDIYHLRRIADKSWYTGFPSEEYGMTKKWTQVEGDVSGSRVSMLRRMVDTSDLLQVQEIGFMRICVPMDDLFQSVDYRKIGENSSVFVVDENDRVIFISGEDDTVKAGMTWADEGAENNRLEIRAALPQTGWQVVTLIPSDITERGVGKVRALTIGISLIVLVIFSVAAILFSRFFSKRVTEITSFLNSFHSGKFRGRIQYEGKDEFSQIAFALNEMGGNIEELIEKVYIADIRKKEAELDSLQSQINPHFLYNTLSSISRLAKFGEVDKLHEMVMNLAKFYRLSLSDGRSIITVAEELMQAQAYIDIQKIKYEDRMHMLFDVDTDVLNFETNKLILQPFIENVLKHAWRGDRIHIRLSAQMAESEEIVFRVIDDGIGMKPETIERIFAEPSGNDRSVGYGIRNVDQRIKLYFGEEYGVSIYSRPGIGTTVMIRIPARKRGA